MCSVAVLLGGMSILNWYRMVCLAAIENITDAHVSVMFGGVLDIRKQI